MSSSELRSGETSELRDTNADICVGLNSANSTRFNLVQVSSGQVNSSRLGTTHLSSSHLSSPHRGHVTSAQNLRSIHNGIQRKEVRSNSKEEVSQLHVTTRRCDLIETTVEMVLPITLRRKRIRHLAAL